MLKDDVIELNNRMDTIGLLYKSDCYENIIVVTNQCNSNCVMCPDSIAVRSVRENVPLENIKTLIALINKDAKFICITGEEPTLLEFLSYVEDSTDNIAKLAKGNLVKNIHMRVQDVKNDISMEVEFMHILKECEAQFGTYILLERDSEKIEEGIEKGEKKKALEIALEMLKDNEPIEKIINYSKLSKEEIEKIKFSN